MKDADRYDLEERAWLRGYAAALAAFAKQMPNQLAARMVLRGDQITLFDMLNAGADKSDVGVVFVLVKDAADARTIFGCSEAEMSKLIDPPAPN